MVRPTWREVLDHSRPLLLPAAHDALTSRLIERAGLSAYQVAGRPMPADDAVSLAHFEDVVDLAK